MLKRCADPLGHCELEPAFLLKREGHEDAWLCEAHGVWAQDGTRQLGGAAELYAPYSMIRKSRTELQNLKFKYDALLDQVAGKEKSHD